ncbi:hypothetical protein KI387_033512, partial [Taxus chinensis]
ANLPISLELPTLELMHQMDFLENKPMEVRYSQLMELEKIRNEVMLSMEKNQAQTKRTFDKKAKARVFNEGDLVLKWDEVEKSQ